MKHLKTFSQFMTLIMFLISMQSTFAQDTISLDDFKVLNDTSWEGTLTYLDYQSGELVPVATTMQIIITDKQIEQNVQYTWEPNKNVKAKTKIKKTGRYLGDQKVISKTIDADGTMHLTTTYVGTDDNNKATMVYTYEFSANHYKVKKEVQFKGSDERFMRNSYDYKKI